MALNLRELEQVSRRDLTGGGATGAFAAGTLGSILASAWAALGDGSKFPTNDLIGIVHAGQEMPETVRLALHVTTRIDGDRLEEATIMAVAAQSDGLIGRLNPTNVPSVLKVDAIKGQQMLGFYRTRHPEVVDWVAKAVTAYIAEKQSAA
jgi:hypothetical protein